MRNENIIVLRTGGDKDILIKEKSLEEYIINAQKKEFILLNHRFNHINLARLYPELELIDLQIKGLSHNNLIFLNEDYFFTELFSKKMILNLALLLHLIIDKGEITSKRKNEFYEGFARLSKKEKKDFFKICRKEYGEKIYSEIKKITKKQEVNIKKLKWKIIFRQLNLFQMISLPLILVSNQIYKHLQKNRKYIVSFLGVDGSGKTTTIENLGKYLSTNSINYKLGNLGVYHQRSFFMCFLEKFIKKEKNESIAKDKLNINYTRKSFIKDLVRTIDIYLRYRKTIKNAKSSKSKIIIFDRYFYDLILQSKIGFFSKFLLKIVPKPDKLFFLYANPENIYQRKKERTPKVLQEQIEKFRNEIKGISNVKEIETMTQEQTLNEVLKELNNKDFLSCL